MRRVSVLLAVVVLLGVLAVGRALSADAQDATPAANPSAGDRRHFDERGHFPWHRTLIAHHWCKQVAGGAGAGGFDECLIFASDAPDAPLVAVELLVDAATYQGFDPAEQRLWDPVESVYGKIILLGDPARFGGLPTGQPRMRGTEPGTPTP